MLTGKAYSLFYSWLHHNGYSAISSSEWFESLHTSMQWGIYQDWADSMGYYISMDWIYYGNYFSPDITTADGRMIWEDEFKTRQEARTAALQKLNEIINRE